MKKQAAIIVLFVILGIITSCSKNKNEDTRKVAVPIELSQHQKDLVVSNNEFGFDIFKTISSTEADANNLFISPLSISLALAMTYNGANGNTKTEMQNTLKFPSLTTDEINGYFQKLSSALLSVDSKVNLGIANSIWYRNEFSVLPAFIQVNKDYYNAEVKSLDFSSPLAVSTINNWVSDKTNKKIPKVIDEISSDIVMFLINAIYFKGSWSQEFDKDGTHNLNFYPSNLSSFVTPMMHQKGSFNYLSNDKFSALEMPYGQGNFTMDVLLPNQGFTTNDIVSSLNSENWNAWMNAFGKQTVDITFPRFKFEYERTLNNDLIGLGMPKAFSTLEADFTNINPAVNLYISFVKHNSFVEVNETGTEAAAVTVVGVGATSAGPDPVVITFNANKPFIFAIRETTTNTILFIGRVSNPI